MRRHCSSSRRGGLGVAKRNSFYKVVRSYHTVIIELSGEGKQTRVSLAQDNNPTEQARDHSEENWGTMLTSLKRFLEQ
jgi:hypothetical protein